MNFCYFQTGDQVLTEFMDGLVQDHGQRDELVSAMEDHDVLPHEIQLTQSTVQCQVEHY